MNAKNKAIIEQGCKITGASKYFFEHKKKYPTYNDIKEAYLAKSRNIVEKTK